MRRSFRVFREREGKISLPRRDAINAFAGPSVVRRSERTEQSRQFFPSHLAVVTYLNSAAGLLTQYYDERLYLLPLFSAT